MTMFENLLTRLPAFDATLGAANAAAIEAAPAVAIAALAVGVVALVAILAAAHGTRRLRQAHAALLATLGDRLAATELLLAETTAELSQARTRLDQLSVRQEATGATAVRSGFRQAIALSRHGATTRQLIDTCGLSQGEAHLIQTLYGRAPATAAGEIH
jgi:hypothetical protein